MKGLGTFFLAMIVSSLDAAATTTKYTGAAATMDPMQVMGQGARPIAMGSAFAAVKADLAGTLFNPASLGFLKGVQASANHHAWLDGIGQESLAIGLGLGNISIGIFGDLINYGQMEETDEQGKVTGNFSATDISVGLSLGHEFGGGLGAGLTLRGVKQSIRDAGHFSITGDLGLIWAFREKTSLGLALTNLGTAVDGTMPTAAIRLGVAHEIAVAQKSKLLLAAAYLGQGNDASQAQVGLEAGISDLIFARAGYQVHLLETGEGGLTGLSTGLGLRFQMVQVDYAFVPYGLLGASHRWSLSYEFGAAPKAQVQLVAKAIPQGDAIQAEKPPYATSLQANPYSVGDAASLQAAAEADPKNSALWRKLGKYHYDRKEFEAMKIAYGHALEADPTDEKLKLWLETMNKTPRN